MNESQDKREKELIDGCQCGVEGKRKLREISSKELENILAKHRIWLESEKNEGYRADLSYVNLEERNLQEEELEGADLQHANLKKAKLQKANLMGANLNYAELAEPYRGRKPEEAANLAGAILINAELRNACLRGVNFQNANLSGADLTNADLCHAKVAKAKFDRTILRDTDLSHIVGLQEADIRYIRLEKAIGLKGSEFSSNDVTGAILPEDIANFKTLEVVEEISVNSRKIFFAMLLGCVYSWLTIATTTDVKLITNSASSPLPIIGTEIPIAWFYRVAPLILMSLYLYFHFYLETLWENLASLPAIFPDGKRLDQRIYPWLLNSLVRRHFNRINKRSITARLKEWITIFLAWWTVPLTFTGFWVRYLPRHEWVGTWIHIGLFFLSIVAGTVFYSMAARRLQGVNTGSFSLKTFWGLFYRCVAILSVGFLLWVISDGAINAVKKDELASKDIKLTNTRELVPWIFDKLGYSPFADFREKDVSDKPEDYYRIMGDDKRLESIKGANLRNRQLRFADMYKAFIVKADVRGADLRGANLRQANLQEANLEKAKLPKADLEGAHLRGANLEQASLRGANLNQVELYKANLRGANLQDAHLQFASLKETDFGGNAILQMANLSGAKLQKANLASANLRGAILSSADLEEAIFADAKLHDAELVGANLQKANFTGAILNKANFENAYLVEADFMFADFREANLMEATLSYAELRATQNLEIEQLSQVLTLYKAKLDPNIKKQIEKDYSHLLEKPE